MKTYSFKIKATGKNITFSASELRRLYFDWSTSKLREFVDCPLRFYFNRIVKVHKNPKMKINPKPILVFGSIIHDVLWRFFSPQMVNGFKSPKSMSNHFIGIWSAFSHGKDFAGAKRQWDWEKIDFDRKDELDFFAGMGVNICKYFWNKNIHYFREQDKHIKPLIEVDLRDYCFGPKKKYKIIGKIDRIELIKDRGRYKAYIIDYKSGSGYGYTPSYASKDWQFLIYEWLYSLHYAQCNTKKAPAPLAGMYVYPLSSVKAENQNPLDLKELIEVKMGNPNKMSNIERLIVSAKKSLQTCLEKGDFPAYPKFNQCGKICPFEKQCSVFLEKHQQVNKRYDRLVNPVDRGIIDNQLILPQNNLKKTKQLLLKFKKTKVLS